MSAAEDDNVVVDPETIHQANTLALAGFWATVAEHLTAGAAESTAPDGVKVEHERFAHEVFEVDKERGRGIDLRMLTLSYPSHVTHRADYARWLASVAVHLHKCIVEEASRPPPPKWTFLGEEQLSEAGYESLRQRGYVVVVADSRGAEFPPRVLLPDRLWRDRQNGGAS